MAANARWADFLDKGRRSVRWQDGKRAAIRHRLGYRGLILLMLGLIYVFIGLAIINAEDYRPDLVHTHLPIWSRVLLWSVPGAVAAVVSLDDKWQAIGFALLFIPPAERAVSYGIAVVTVPTWTRVPGLLIYVLLMLLVTFVASWPEPAEVQKKIRAQDDGSLTHGDDGKYLDEDGTLRDRDRDDAPVDDSKETDE